MGACGLNNTDINTRTAWYAPEVKSGITEDVGSAGIDVADQSQATWGGSALDFPRIQGADVAGTLVAVGAGISENRVGQRVLCDPWLLAAGDYLDTTASLYLGSELDGGFAEYMTLRSENVHAIESDLSDAELAAFPCALTTAENSNRKRTPARERATGASASQRLSAVVARAKAVAITSVSADQLGALGADQYLDCLTNLAEELGVIDALDVVGQGMFGPLIGAAAGGATNPGAPGVPGGF